jgi:hypothetical protein
MLGELTPLEEILAFQELVAKSQTMNEARGRKREANLVLRFLQRRIGPIDKLKAQQTRIRVLPIDNLRAFGRRPARFLRRPRPDHLTSRASSRTEERRCPPAA